MRRSRGVMIGLAGLSAACAGLSTQRALELPADALYDRNIVVVRQPAPPLAAAGLDEDLVRSHALADPAARIGRGLAISLATERGMIVLSTSGIAADAADAAALAAAHPGADYVLDVKTLEWALDNYATARDRYRLEYAAQLRLIDAEGRVVAATRCRSEQGDVDKPPSREDLLVQDAALVKGYLDLATARCIEHAAGEMLGLRAPGTRVASARGEPIRVPPPEPSSAAAQVPLVVAAPMPSVHDFFDEHAAPAPTPTPKPAPATARPLPTPRPTPQAVAILPPRATPSPTPLPRPSPTAAPPRAEPQIAAVPAPTPAAPAVAPGPAPAAEDELLRTDRLTPAARASGQVIELLEDTAFRDSPRLRTRVSRTLPAGTELVVRQRVYNAEGEWWFIIIPGDIGWMRSPDPIPYGSPRTGTDTRPDKP